MKEYIDAVLQVGARIDLTMKPSISASRLDDKTRFRIQLKHAVAIGPGKADVLQGIAETGSLAETGRRMRMSYQRVWSLVAAMNVDFVEPLVLKQRGGAAGGGAQLTPAGARVLETYRAIEGDAQRAVAKRLPQLLALIRPDAGAGEPSEQSTGVATPSQRPGRSKPATVPKCR